MKIPSSVRVRSYELTFLVPGSETSDVVKGMSDVVEKTINKHKIEVVTKQEWGKRPLAYPIKHAGKNQMEAYYFHFGLKADASLIPALEADLRLDQKLMRTLLIQVDDNDLKEVNEMSGEASEEDATTESEKPEAKPRAKKSTSKAKAEKEDK